jgi:hypothetical protein
MVSGPRARVCPTYVTDVTGHVATGTIALSDRLLTASAICVPRLYSITFEKLSRINTPEKQSCNAYKLAQHAQDTLLRLPRSPAT